MINVALLDYELKQANLPIIGVSSDGRIDYSRELTQDEINTVASILSNHDPNGLLPNESGILEANNSYLDLPDMYRNGTYKDSETYINDNVFSGFSVDEANSWIDSYVTSLATAKVALKQIASAVITLKNITLIMVKLLYILRDIIIRFK